ncbi:hypothetical protein MNBD_ALPHA02-229 [hydrothermal vent metagenome]|uniref:Gluconate 2-dehydrogenase subunit 3 family protein n=1 Tax=hydrothermal vent metagenome TaxID=652676 RepID=A0A3B0RPE8_9ZZZZ
MKISRRGFSLGSGAFTLAFLLDGKVMHLTPAEAKARNTPFQTITVDQAALIDLLGNAIVPGAKTAGLSRYIDHQLSTRFSDNLLIIRYLGVNPPFDDFYRASLTAFENAVKQRYDKKPADLSDPEMTDFITVMMQKNPAGWDSAAPPAPFFYFVLRSDAIDVTYGTMDAFDQLDIPYMAHIEPAHPWKVTP